MAIKAPTCQSWRTWGGKCASRRGSWIHSLGRSTTNPAPWQLSPRILDSIRDARDSLLFASTRGRAGQKKKFQGQHPLDKQNRQHRQSRQTKTTLYEPQFPLSSSPTKVLSVCSSGDFQGPWHYKKLLAQIFCLPLCCRSRGLASIVCPWRGHPCLRLS